MRNGKLGSSIFHFDLPAVTTCPGSSQVCRQFCYATHGRFSTKVVQRRLRWCYRQSRQPDFAPNMIREVKARGVIVLRLHVSGDLYDGDYAWKWLEVMQGCPKVRFYLYTRSWRVPSILPAIQEMARLANVRVWLSCDADTGEPREVPEGARLCFMQHAPEAVPEKSELVFRVRGMRRHPRVGLPLVCPQETHKEVNCGNCQVCWR